MGDKQQTAAKLQQLLFQPLNGVQIQMIGRLIKQQQIRLADQRPAQQHPPPPATGQLGQRRIRRQAQTAENGLGALLPAPALARFQFMLQAFHPAQPLRRGIVDQGGSRLVILRQQRAQPFQTAGNHFEHGRRGVSGQFLGQSGQTQAGLAPDLATVRLNLGSQQAQQGGLARAVATNQTDPLARINLEAGLIEQRFGAKGNGNVVNTQKWHLSINSP